MAGWVNRNGAVLGLLTLVFCLAAGGGAQAAPATDPIWQPLIAKLAHDGENVAVLQALFSDPEVEFDPRVMPRKLTHQESKLNYGRFLEPDRLRRAEAYLYDNRHLLAGVEQTYGVPKEVKVAILLVETDLGRVTGSARVFNILASMAVASDMDRVSPWLPKEIREDPAQRAAAEKVMKRKSRWAYGELRSLLVYARQNGYDPLEIRGSIFGAFGLCQFMPSNALKLGVDGDGDGRVNLFSRADAIASMANYLREHGWRPDLDHQGQLKVVYAYNHSTPYAETILAIADRLSRMEKDDARSQGSSY